MRNLLQVVVVVVVMVVVVVVVVVVAVVVVVEVAEWQLINGLMKPTISIVDEHACGLSTGKSIFCIFLCLNTAKMNYKFPNPEL